MKNIIEEDQVKWKFVGGSICLDFINTVGGRLDAEEGNSNKYKIIKDKLHNYADLIDWGNDAGIISKISAKNLNLFYTQNPDEGDKIFKHAIDIRETFYRIFTNIILNIPLEKDDVKLLNKECSAAREEQKLFFKSNKFVWDFEPNILFPESIIWHVSLSAAELLTSQQVNKTKQCPGENCGWLFIDGSKNGSRLWCDMKVCGNLSKVHRFRNKKLK